MASKSKKFFLIFSKESLLQPRLFKTIKTVEKYRSEQPEYEIIQYTNEIMANDALQIKKIQYSRNLKIFKLQSETQSQVASLTPCSSAAINPCPIQQPPSMSSYTSNLNYLYSSDPPLSSMLSHHHPTLIKMPINQSVTYNGYFDGCSKSNPGPSGVGYYILEGTQIVFQAAWPLGKKTNNQAEFNALLYLLIDAYCNGIRRIQIYGDSKLVVNSANKINKIAHPNIAAYAQSIDQLLQHFTYYKIHHIDRSFNAHADRLANLSLKKKSKDLSVNELT